MSQKEPKPRIIERTLRELNASSSVRMDKRGNPLIRITPAEAQQNIKDATGAQAFGITAAEPEYFTKFRPERPPITLPNVSEFTPVLNSPREAAKRRRYSVDEIKEKIALLIEKAGKVTENFYTPIMHGESQVLITEYVWKMMCDIALALDAQGNLGMEILAEPQPAEVIHSVTRAFLYPTSIPVSEPNDFDSGSCDNHLNTSFRRGDKGQIVARVENYAFFISDYGTYGWVDEAHLGTDPEHSVQLEEAFYSGGQPLFFTYGKQNFVVLPGDSIYLDGQVAYIKSKSAKGKTKFIPLPSKEKNIAPKFDLSTTEGLQTAVSFLQNLDMPYMWAVFDCSEVLRRLFLMGGIQMPKFSGDMMVALRELSPQQMTISAPEEISQLEDGVYIMNMLSKAKSSIHMFFTVKRDGQLQSFSYAFDLQGDGESRDMPIGPHTCGVEAMKKELVNGKQYVATLIAK